MWWRSRLSAIWSGAGRKQLGLEDENRILKESRERFRSLVESASDLVTELDCQGRFVYASPSFRERLGHAPEDLIGRHPFDFVHADVTVGFQRHLVHGFDVVEELHEQSDGILHALQRL